MTQRMNLTMAIVILLVAVPVVALAQGDSQAAPAVSQILGHLIEILASALIVVVGFLVRRATVYFEERTKVDIPAKQERMLAEWAGRAVDYAREQAHKQRKKHGPDMRGSEKFDSAMQFGLDLAEEHGLPDKARLKLARYIEAKLGQDREA